MAVYRTIDFLPEVFQTPTNRQYLAATLEQLTQEPQFKKTQGYVGRRVGPGVAAGDVYVTEPSMERTDYQLEPSVVSLVPDTNTVQDSITFPGITDAIQLQGGFVDNADRLYTSEYYSWDPFVDFDKMVNFTEYYWLPTGPLPVDVFATDIPLASTYYVTRANGVYTFSGTSGNNPNINLARGGTYTFKVAQQPTSTTNLLVGNNLNNFYFIDYHANPDLTFVRGNTYIFNISTVGFYPLYIKTQASLGTTNVYSDGVYNNGAVSGFLKFTVPQDAPDTLYYCCSTQENMRGTITVVDSVPGEGPKFWLQSEPGKNGVLNFASNISSRSVLGVVNNGIDLGSVTFTVPAKLAQENYYNMIDGGVVDLVSTTVPYSDVQGKTIEQFATAFPDGIDQINNLDERTIIFADGSSPVVGIYQAQYITIGSDTVINLLLIDTPADNTQFFVQFGTQWAQTHWYKDTTWHETPLLTAVLDTIWYQDSDNANMFGALNLIDQDNAATIKIDDILGHKNYTSPNGVVFTNGLIVNFVGVTEPSSYSGNAYVVEGVGESIRLVLAKDLVTPETYNQFSPIPFDTTPYDIGAFDASAGAPIVPNYVTISRASPDLNPWSRNNRWFHIDVINASYAYNNLAPMVDVSQRASRPILEFNAGLRLYNFGTKGTQAVNVIDFDVTDAMADVQGQASYIIDGYNLGQDAYVIFANDTDQDVRNKIFRVDMVAPDTIPPYIAEPLIHLVEVDAPTVDNNTVCLSGLTQTGQSYRFDGLTWLPTQQKTAANYPASEAWPRFDVYDSNGISFGDRIHYPSTTFAGSYLFSYKLSTSSVIDSILGFSLSYYSLNNIGDILYENNLYTDTFNYISNGIGQVGTVSSGFVRQYTDRTVFRRQIGWQTAITASISRQQFQTTYNGDPIRLDVAVVADTTVPPIQLFVDNVYVEPYQYSWTVTANTTTIILDDKYAPGAMVEIDVISDQVSSNAFYTVPVNLENNPLNGNPSQVTLGTVRTHYESICTNLYNLRGPINGANNSRDLGNIVPYGLQILQQSSPMTMAGYFMRSQDYDVFQAIPYNSREYIKFKSKLLEYAVSNDLTGMSASAILDQAITDLTTGRTSNDAFYWGDMLPWGSNYTLTQYTVNPITGQTFNTIQTYTFTSANYLGVLVYITETIAGHSVTRMLEKNYDYVVSTDSPQITLLFKPAVGDVVAIREYSDTAGSFVPNTPSKMGLYPKYRPEQFLDTSYVNPTVVIRGHDGSITVAFNDIRDEVLLEFERRIYNNIKVDDNPIPLLMEQVIPGFFRETDYTREEIFDILGDDFLSWVGWNKLDYKTQDYLTDNEFTYNYSTAGAKLNSSYQVDNVNETPLPGAWRGIYQWFYDSMSPSLRPWELLGFSEQPSWWTARYDTAPYTSGNLVLWDDLQAGYVADPVKPYINPLYVRNNLDSVIPSGYEGALLSPLQSVVGLYNPLDFRKSWSVGDGGPVEAAWWTSSSFPFAVMRLLALTRPAQFFSLFADRDLYRYDTDLGQFLYNGRYRLDANGVEIYGNGTSKASFINWIVDYNRQLGLDSTTLLTAEIQNLDVRLSYRMAGFTDKLYTTVVVESSTPNSNNKGQQLPAESYQLKIYKNQPFQSVVYSAVVIEVATNGFTVYGYDNINPYFTIMVSMSGGALRTVEAGDVAVQVPNQWTDKTTQVPYGYTFANTEMVVDFILSYGKYLATQGIAFLDVQNGLTMNWEQMAAEFLYFSGQGWSAGTIMNLNPAALLFTAARPYAVVDSIESIVPENMVLDQNRNKFATRNLVIERLGNSFKIQSAAASTISFLRLRFTSYENIMILDNVSIFNDLIYDPITAARQTRIQLASYISAEWDGVANAPGFIYNYNNVKEWHPNRKYTKGEIVKYKRQYWQALTIVPPKEKFDYNDWSPSNYTRIQQGMLANIANKADEMSNSYDVHKGALDPDMNLLAFGLIGFRPRQYMTALDLDDVSQVNVYQQMISSKGTRRATDLFTNASVGREVSEYHIYENWAVLAATYGANADRSFIEIQLNEALLTSNPCTVEVIAPGQSSEAEQTTLYTNLWRQSAVITSPNIFPVTYDDFASTALPSAGYVDVEDVDIMVFSLDDPSVINEKLTSIGIGTTIWSAKSNAYDWNVYRCSAIPAVITTVADNLNSTALVVFDGHHNLVVGDLFLIRYVTAAINGVYRVLNTPSTTTVIISFDFQGANQSSISCSGLGLYLQSSRVSQPSDVINLPFANLMLPGAKVWVDNDGSGHWQTLEKKNPFAEVLTLIQTVPTANSGFGSAVCQTESNVAALVGAPAINMIYAYARGAGTTLAYRLNINLEFPITGVSEFGAAVACGQRLWSAGGAPGTSSSTGAVLIQRLLQANLDYIPAQILMGSTVGSRFGAALCFSWDEQWMAVGAPGANTVDVYGRVTVEPETVSYYGNGTTVSYNYDNTILIDNTQPGQLMVVVNAVELTTSQYSLASGNVIFNTAPALNATISITRRESALLDFYVYQNVSAVSAGSGTGARFTVSVLRGQYTVTLIDSGVRYAAGRPITILGTSVGGTSPANDITVTVTAVSAIGAITRFTYAGSGKSNTSTFALAPLFYSVTSLESFIVTVSKQMYRPGIDYTYVAGNLVFLTIPAAGEKIIVRAGSYWKHITTLADSSLPVRAEYGHAISMTSEGRQILVSAPADQNTLPDGAVYAYNRSIIRFQVTDPSVATYDIGSHHAPVQVIVNGTQLLDADLNLNGQYRVVANTVTLVNLALQVGDNIEIGTNNIELIDRLTLPYSYDDARFGDALDLCLDNDELYVGAPWDGKQTIQGGSVTRFINQSRMYGITTSTVANPTLTSGDTIRINDLPVTLAGTTVADLVNSINAADVPNVIATNSLNIDYIGDGATKTFDAGTLYDNATAFTPVVTVNGITQIENVDYTYANSTVTFVQAPSYGATIVIVGGRITISVINPQGGFQPYSDGKTLLTVLPGTGTLFTDLGIDTFVFAQSIYSPLKTDYGRFGSSVSIDTSSVNLCVGAANGTAYEPTTFDSYTTYFDSHSTIFSDLAPNTGVVYTFDYLPAATQSISNPGMFVFGQQLWDVNQRIDDRWGFAVSYTSGRLLIGVPRADYGQVENSGSVRVFDNTDNQPSWAVIHYQQPAVDTRLIASVFSYDRLLSDYQQYYDFINPLQGKILGAASRNIDYVGAVDPAMYNVGPIHNVGNSWGEEHLGQIWWDTNSVRFINPNQDSIVYASRRWGSVFPGSTVDVYQWIGSAVPPSQYVGPGTPLSTLTYTVNTALNQQSIFTTTYYFWVRGLLTVATTAGKTLSTTAIANYIADPRSSGIPYAAILGSGSVALYNAPDISAQDTILHIEYDQTLNTADIHQEFQLVQEGVEGSFVTDVVYQKLLDSFCGVDSRGALVPDPNLSPGERYGVQFRPRQSMFVNRYGALQNYIGFTNRILKQYPISEMRSFPLLYAHEPIPPATDGSVVNWNQQVANIEELSYQDIALVPEGYRYLVTSDSTQFGFWTIYTKLDGKLVLSRIENYDVPRYWSFVDWYTVGYNPSTKIFASVPNYAALAGVTLQTAPIGSSVKVDSNSQGKWEIYQRAGLQSWTRVGLQDGTIQISDVIWNYQLGRFGYDAEVYDAQYFDQDPVIETRYIINSINTELFIDELLIYRNEALMLMFQYIYSELETPEWLVKTSLIDVTHRIRTLAAYPTYQPDNQTFVLDYLNEVKPYHTVVRDFNIIYDGLDTYPGLITDYDCPARWDLAQEIPQYISPILMPYAPSTSTRQNDASNTEPNAQIWLERPWSEWFNNYTLHLESIRVIDGGTGYTATPVVTITGACAVAATATAMIDSAGTVVAITVTNAGSGYTATPVVTITGVGTGARAYPVMNNNLVRRISATIKFDRYQYDSTILPWAANVKYTNGTLVRFNDRVYSANGSAGYVMETQFNPEDWTPVPAAELSGVDRTMGYYVPGVNMPGLNLALLVDGVDYPGVEVVSQDYVTLNNTQFGIDCVYSSAYRDIYLGARPSDIVVTGSEYVDTYASHAPEELVPGQMFDTLDIRVTSRTGQPAPQGGWGYPEAVVTERFATGQAISWAGILPYTAVIVVSNETAGTDLAENVDYTVDWINQTVLITSGAAVNDIIIVSAFGIGGGFQLYENEYTSADITTQIVIPVAYSEILEPVVFINGVNTTAFGWASTGTNQTTITLLTPLTSTQRLTLVVFGPTYIDSSTTVDYGWSTAVAENIAATTGTLTYALSNSLLWTNPVNFVCNVNGIRARGPAANQYISDGSQQTYPLPNRLGLDPATILDSDIIVYLNSVELNQSTDYVINSSTDPNRTITLNTVPAAGDQILVAVLTGADVTVQGTNLVFSSSSSVMPITGATIVVTTWNDTRQQGISTRVFVGPVVEGTFAEEPYDTTEYSVGLVTGAPGSYDYGTGVDIITNDLNLGQIVADPSRLWVTINGRGLFYGFDFTLETVGGVSVLQLTNLLQSTDVLIVTLFTDEIVGHAAEWHLFSDMRGVEAVYTITPATTTATTASVNKTADVIPVANAAALPVPDLTANRWGVVMIGAERIMFRGLDTTANTISGLLRGTAGTAALDHPAGQEVISMSSEQLANRIYQNYVDRSTTLADGVATTFAAEFAVDASTATIQVFVGGTRVTTGYTVDSMTPVTVTFGAAPDSGVEVDIIAERSLWWLNPE